MRTIKFRAWNTDGMVTQPLDGLFGLQRFLGFLHEDAELMQYTGLKDKNGKEIYEGDIVTADNLVCVVEWGSHGWVAKWERPRRGTIDYGKPDLGFRLHEVIGNIYEHKDLMEAEK